MNYRKYFGVVFLLITQFVYAEFGQTDLVKINLSQGNWKVDAGSQFKIVLNASIKESWHINSNKPNDDFLIASKVTAKSGAVTLANINYPQPKELKLEFSEKPVSVFGGDIKIELTFTVNKNTASGKYTIPVKLSYQACNDQTCMPPTDVSENLTVEVVGTAQEMKSELANAKGETEEVKSETSNPPTGRAGVKGETSNVNNE